MLISIAICTYRRPECVGFALESLRLQSSLLSDWAVLLIENDNAASSELIELCQQFNSKLPLRHIVENKIGLSHARNTAIRESSSDYVAFLDDDAVADSDWVSSLQIECRASKLDFCGGPSYPLYRSVKPSWFLDRYATSYDYGAQPKWLKEGEWLGGMNFVINRELCLRLGGFRVDLGMAGESVAYGEDTEIQLRAWVANPQLKVRFSPQASVRHEVRSEKMSLLWKMKSAWAGGIAASILSPMKRKQAIWGVIGDVKQLTKEIVSTGLSVDLKKEDRRCWQQWIFEIFCTWLWGFSRNYHSFWRQGK